MRLIALAESVTRFSVDTLRNRIRFEFHSTGPALLGQHAVRKTSPSHTGLAGITPARRCGAPAHPIANLDSYRWRKHCNSIFQTPAAA